MQLSELIVERIKFFRQKQKLSQDSLSKRAELELKYINKIEKKKIGITLTTLESIIKALDVSYSEFFDFSKLEGSKETREQEIDKLTEKESKEILLQLLDSSDEFEGRVKKIKQNLNAN